MSEVKEKCFGEYRGVKWKINLMGLKDGYLKKVKELGDVFDEPQKWKDKTERTNNSTWWVSYIYTNSRLFNWSRDDKDEIRSDMIHKIANKFIRCHHKISYHHLNCLGWDYNHREDTTWDISKERVENDIKRAIDDYLENY